MIRGAAIPGGNWRMTFCESGRQLAHGHTNVGAGLEEDFDDRAAGDGLRFDVLDVIDDGGHVPLVVRDDVVFHLLRGEAAVVPGNADDRNVDFGKDVGRGALQHERGHQNDDQREYDEGVGTA